MAGLLLISLGLVISPASGQNYDPQEFRLKASDLLDADEMSGPHYRIDERVVNTDYMNQYLVKSDFGEFAASSDDELEMRINEVAAIVTLQTMTKSEVFTSAMMDTAKKPVQMIQNVVKEPVSTVKGIPAGATRLFKRTVRVVGDTVEKSSEFVQEKTTKKDTESSAEGDDQSAVDKGLDKGEEYSKKYLGYTSSIRKLARGLGVDPYSSNKILQEELGTLAWAMTAGSFLTGKAMPSIPKEVSYMGDLNELVWDTDPLDLQLLNEKHMEEMGASKALIESFYDNENYSPSMSTRLVGSLYSMERTEGRTLILEQAAVAKNKSEGRIYRILAETLSIAHVSSPVAQILSSSIWPMARLATGSLIFVLPVDYVVWTETSSAAIQKLTKEAHRIDASGNREFWIMGRVSDLARAEMEALGWTVLAQYKPGTDA